MWLTQLLMWADVQIIKVVNGKLWEILLVPEEAARGNVLWIFYPKSCWIHWAPSHFFKIRISPFCFFLCIKTAWNIRLATEAKAHQLYMFALLLLFLHIRDDSQSVPWNNPFILVMYIPKQQYSNELWISESRSTTNKWLNNLFPWKCHIFWQGSYFSGINKIKRFGLELWSGNTPRKQVSMTFQWVHIRRIWHLLKLMRQKGAQK